MDFYKLRSFIGHFFSETMQMKIIIVFSEIFWFFRKYFLGIDFKFDQSFIKNWSLIKKNGSSQDKIRNFDLYQLIKIHNKIFKNKNYRAIHFHSLNYKTLIYVKPLKELGYKIFVTL